MKVNIEKIRVSEERARKTFENIDKLAQSIQEFGLIEPIVIDREFNLIAGERRLRACQMIDTLAPTQQTKEIEAFFIDELDEWRRRAMELEENLQRENLTYAEECEAKLRLHELYQEKYGKTEWGKKGGWSMPQTAELLGDSVGETNQDITLAKAIRVNPELGKKDTKSAAFKSMKAKEELEIRTKIAEVLANDTKIETHIQLIKGDSREVLKQYEDDSFDFCVTDPPWGVNLDDSTDLSKVWDVRVDGLKGLEMQGLVFEEVYRVLRPGSHCYVFFAMMLYTETYELLTKCGFKVSKIPLIWDKEKGGTNYDPYHLFTPNYESIFYCSKGSPKSFTKLRPDSIFRFPTPPNKIHPTEKPLGLIEELTRLCSVEGERGLDPFGGSGVFWVACKGLERRCVVIEIDPEYYTIAWERMFGGGGEKE
jgi:DNA modification methylase